MNKPPVVFVCHASEDKDRFVLGFGRSLRANGVDAWIDEWEIQLGESVVEKIEQGIDRADAFIVVVSKDSVAKPWVRRELNVATIRMVEQQTSLIPVIIDDCKVPTALKTQNYHRVADLADPEPTVRRIIASLLGTSDKPELGTLPNYATTSAIPFAGLTRIDSLVLQVICENVVRNETYQVVGHMIWPEVEALGITDEDYSDSLMVLDDQRLIKTTWRRGDSRNSIHMVSPDALDQYLVATIANYQHLARVVAVDAVNHVPATDVEISGRTDVPRFLVEQNLRLLRSKGLAQVSIGMSFLRINSASVTLKRQLSAA